MKRRNSRWRSTSSGGRFTEAGFAEAILPSIYEAGPFVAKIGADKASQMWTFDDRKGRPCCLIPEATAILQEAWRYDLSKRMKAPLRLFYVQRCYRYERPQAGRYREFTQFGVEILGADAGGGQEAMRLLEASLGLFGDGFEMNPVVNRGIGYYLEDGFEAEAPWLGAQKQLAGGGRYAEGVGWAIGVDRLLLAVDARDRKP